MGVKNERERALAEPEGIRRDKRTQAQTWGGCLFQFLLRPRTQSMFLNNWVRKQSQGMVSPVIFALLILYTALGHSPIWFTESVLLILQAKDIRDQLRHYAQFSLSYVACDPWPLQTALLRLSFLPYLWYGCWLGFSAPQSSLPWRLQRWH